MSNNAHAIPSPVLVNQQAPFEKLIEKLKAESVLAVDTEANSLYAYQEQVCLIQISTSKADFIIDPLSVSDLSPLGEVFQDPSIEKIFHASEYDIIILHEDFQFQFKNLFDTMLAAQILGRKKLGLDALLEEFVGIQVNKKYQRANWGRRPLPDDMLRYAQIDTHFLIKIRNHLAEELRQRGLTPIAEEDFSRACLAYQNVREDTTAPCWKIKGARKLSPKNAAVLSQLCAYREKVAQKIDKPVFKVIGAKTLLKLAERSPSTKEQMLRLEIPGKKNIQRHADGLYSAIRAGLDSKPLYPPHRERKDDAYLARENALRNWRKQTARSLKVNSAVVLPRDLLYEVVANNPQRREELGAILKDVPWRLENYGDDILTAVKKANQGGRIR
jgi:ribonuclease D